MIARERINIFTVRYRVKSWPTELRDAFEERAAIMEYDGGLPREEAEITAYELLEAKANV